MKNFTDFFLTGRALDLALAELNYILVYQEDLLEPACVDVPEALRETLQMNMLTYRLGNEQARREAIVSPILTLAAHRCGVAIYTEERVESAEVGGVVDYWVPGGATLLVIEAKHDDIDRGLGQLCAELIAAAVQPDVEEPPFGVVTSGLEWRFAAIDSQAGRIVANQQIHHVPSNLDTVVQLLVAALGGAHAK